MSYRGTGQAFVNTTNPEAFAVCDRCGAWRNRGDLVFQMDYRGNSLANLRLLVCSERGRCNDAPFEHNRPIIVPPDPVPVKDPRPEFFTYSEDPNLTGVTKEELLDELNGSGGGS